MDPAHPTRARIEATYIELEKIASEVNARIAAEERQRHIFEVYSLLDGT